MFSLLMILEIPLLQSPLPDEVPESVTSLLWVLVGLLVVGCGILIRHIVTLQNAHKEEKDKLNEKLLLAADAAKEAVDSAAKDKAAAVAKLNGDMMGKQEKMLEFIYSWKDTLDDLVKDIGGTFPALESAIKTMGDHLSKRIESMENELKKINKDG